MLQLIGAATTALIQATPARERCTLRLNQHFLGSLSSPILLPQASPVSLLNRGRSDMRVSVNSAKCESLSQHHQVNGCPLVCSIVSPTSIVMSPLSSTDRERKFVGTQSDDWRVATSVHSTSLVDTSLRKLPLYFKYSIIFFLIQLSVFFTSHLWRGFNLMSRNDLCSR